MQLCSWSDTGSLGAVPVHNLSPRRLELLERRITGSSNPPRIESGGSRDRHPEQAVPASPVNNMVTEQPIVAQTAHAVQQHGTTEEPIYIPDTQEETMLPAELTAAVQAVAAAAVNSRKSPTPSGAEVPMSASKRRKTGKPQHRPVEPASSGADSKQGLPASAASNGAVKDTVQRDKPVRARHSPRVKSEGAPAAGGSAGDAVAGGSNPPMSPTPTDRQGIHIKTPRSTSKQQYQQQHSKGQTKVNQFFSPLVDGSSRDSDTPSVFQQHREQQFSQQYREQQQHLVHIQQASPIEGLIEPRQQAATLPGQATSGIAGTPPMAASEAAIGAAAHGRGHSRRNSCGAGSGGSSGVPAGHDAAGVHQQLAAIEQKYQQELETLRQEARQREVQLSEQLITSQRQADQMQGMLQQLHKELAEAKTKGDAREQLVQDAVTKLVVQLAQRHGELARLQLGSESSRIGTLGVARTGALGFTEVWEDGPILRDLAVRKAALHKAREEVDAARKALKKQLPPPPKATLTADASNNATHDAAGNLYISSEQYVMQDEILKVRLSVLRREEELLSKEEERLQQEKIRHLRALKRMHDEECSRFQQQPTLHRRYVLVQLLGRGGFSEVHRAYDLQTLKFVAIKIHQLNSTWSEQRKASYVKHSVREYQIHKRLRHANIVSLTDIFEVDVSTFATVLELCEGGDLEGHLQQYGTLPEREARALITQVFAGLAYLNGKRPPGGEDDGPRVIHYDLKPANILFNSLGTVKITDFGLSKVVEDGQTMGMDLTSQGAGTYWYLPPECFQTGSSSSSMGSSRPGVSAGVCGLLPGGLLSGVSAAAAAAPAAPKISNKVDVWSAGVILYQMLYGKRPFGEGLTQEQIYRDGVMLNARQVQFPSKPSVSAEGKAFLSRCLAYSQEERWDVLTAAADAYLQLKR